MNSQDIDQVMQKLIDKTRSGDILWRIWMKHSWVYHGTDVSFYIDGKGDFLSVLIMDKESDRSVMTKYVPARAFAEVLIEMLHDKFPSALPLSNPEKLGIVLKAI